MSAAQQAPQGAGEDERRNSISSFLGELRQRQQRRASSHYVRPDLHIVTRRSSVSSRASISRKASMSRKASVSRRASTANRKASTAYAGRSASVSSSSPITPSAPKVQFGLHDALTFETLRSLRKVFFRPEPESENDESEQQEQAQPATNSEDADQPADGKGGGGDDEKNGKDNNDAAVSSSNQEDYYLDDAQDESDDDEEDIDNWESRDLDLEEFIAQFGHIIGPNLSR